jgi:SAM-dependent methyltransferase
MADVTRTVFGEVAQDYDQVRPGYPDEIAASILAYHGAPPSRVVEIGAGTGKATAVLRRVGAPMTCVEPDARMAAVLQAACPDVEVHHTSFERWTAPPGGVPVIACAMAWHWLAAETRNQHAHDALVPGGTLAVFGHRYDYADPDLGAAVGTVLRAIDPALTERPSGWFRDDIAGSGLFADITVEVLHRQLTLSKEQFLRLNTTFGPYRTRSPQQRAAGLAALGGVVDRFGGTVVLDLPTTLVLARRPA